MRDDQAKIALADAMHLHDERLANANAEVYRLRAELEAAERRQTMVREARIQFMRYVQPNAAGKAPAAPADGRP